MTTKKQRRENVARKTAERREAERLENLKMLRKSQEKTRLVSNEDDKAERSKKHARALSERFAV